jgi:hypothetical protein
MQTKANQDIILAAISKYADRRDSAVPANPPDPGPGGVYDSGALNMTRSDALQDSDVKWNIFVRCALLYRDLEAEPECKKMLDNLPRGVIMRGQLDEPAAFVDAYGNYMDYQEKGGFGGPLLISGGPDGYIGGINGGDDVQSGAR